MLPFKKSTLLQAEMVSSFVLLSPVYACIKGICCVQNAMDWSEVGRFALKCTRQYLQYHLVRAQSPPENPKGEALWSGQLRVSICVSTSLCGIMWLPVLDVGNFTEKEGSLGAS